MFLWFTVYISQTCIKFGIYTTNLHFVILLCHAVSNDVIDVMEVTLTNDIKEQHFTTKKTIAAISANNVYDTVFPQQILIQRQIIAVFNDTRGVQKVLQLDTLSNKLIIFYC